MAHDLGHPPFGHAAEYELDRLVRNPELAGGELSDAADDGYEGNAQTFRILTKLAVRFSPDEPGLNMTRATLAATLKYPWLREIGHPKKGKKWSAYKSEERQFNWARQECVGEFKSAEAELMDWADDIAYSVHDLEDFHRVGVIQWQEIVSEKDRGGLIQSVVKDWEDKEKEDFPADASVRVTDALERITRKLTPFPTIASQTYNGEREQRRQLRNFTSVLIGHYVRALKLSSSRNGPAVIIEQWALDEVRVLKYFARRYIISLPALHAQQYGQKKIIRDLFGVFLREGKDRNFKLFPARLRYIWQEFPKEAPARLAADCVASLTENEVYQLHGRLMGMESGLVLDPIVR